MKISCQETVSQPIVVLPYDLAIVFAAQQNFERDVRVRLQRESSWEAERGMYLRESAEFLKERGVNTAPYFKDHETIRVCPETEVPAKTTRACAYAKAVDAWYERMNQAYLNRVEFNEPKPFPSEFKGL